MIKKRKWRLKQKWTGLIISVLCFVSLIAYAVADATPTLKVSVTNPVIAAQNGQDAIVDRSDQSSKKTVTYHLTFENDKEFNSLSFFINYDPTKLKLISYQQTPKSPSPSENVMEEEDGLLVWSIMYMGSPTNTSLDIGDITFEVLETASGSTEITLTQIAANKITNGGQTLTPVAVNGVNERIFIRVPVIESSIKLATPSLDLDLAGTNSGSIMVDYSPKDTTDDKNFTYTVMEGADVVKVENGVVTGLKIGNAKIKVTAFGKSFEVPVTVKEHLREIKINHANLTNGVIKVNRNNTTSLNLTATTTPETTSDTVTYNWSSSNTGIASIDNNGKVTITGLGKTNIIVNATSLETGEVKTDSIELIVNAPATSVNILENAFTLNKTGVDTSKTLTWEINPTDTDDTKKWTSSNTAVATVDQNGKVTAVEKGTAIITLTVGSVLDSVEVTVNVPVTDITLDTTNITLIPTQTRKIIASVLPTNANDKTISWNVGDTNIATVSSDGTVTAVNPGVTTLSIQSGTITKTVSINVLTPVNGLIINVPAQTLKVGETLNLVATPTAGADETGKMTWTSSNPAAATVDQNGKVTAVASNDGSASTTTITATWTSNTDSTHKETTTSVITVINPISKIELNKNKIELNGKGLKETLNATLTPNPTSSDKTITWTSSDTSVATVTNDGTVTSVGKGTATITATTSNGLIATAEVIVTIPTSNITINGQKEITMNINTTNTLTAVVNPSDTSDTLSWISSNSEIVSVSQTGLITAKNAGTVTITAKSGSKEDQLTVHVVIPVTSFDLVSNSDIKVLKGTTSTIVTKINPTNATDQKITWKSQNEDIASVNENGIITALKQGNTVITGSLSNGMKVNVNVEVEIIPITSMKIEQKELALLRKESQIVELIIEPENTTEKDQIIWKSSDEDVAVVDEFGKISALKEGTATITATYKDIEVSTEVKVTEIHLESISLENTKNELNVGDTTKLNVVLNPIDVTDDLIYTYTSSDESIATVDENGNVVGLKPGKVTFTIEVNGMKLTQEMTIRKVVNPQTGIHSVAGYAVVSVLSLIGIAYLIRKKASLK
jgi:uncharacterized protein YjdB